MALLTADDVLNKKFQATKFREGYDQDEVDDFLDEVVNTLRETQNENEDLKSKLAAAGDPSCRAAAVVGDGAPRPGVLDPHARLHRADVCAVGAVTAERVIDVCANHLDTGEQGARGVSSAWRVACDRLNVRYREPRWSVTAHRLDQVRPKR